MALILLADKLACDCIFHDEPLSIEQVKGYVVSESAVRVEDRAYDELVSLIGRNVSKFNDFSQDAWGRINNNVATINKQVLEQELTRMGFDFNSVKKGWDKQGRLIKNSVGRYIHQTKVNGVKGSYIKIQLPEDSGFVPIEGPTPFDEVGKQEELAF